MNTTQNPHQAYLNPDRIRDMAETAIRKALVGPMTPQREKLFAELRAMPDNWFDANVECRADAGKWVAAFTAARQAAE